MNGRKHGWWCNARTYPTTCRYCGAEVFYFSCDCGCKVFFDALGPPWPRHQCAELPLQATLWRDVETGLLETLVALRDLAKLDLSRQLEEDYARRMVTHKLPEPHRTVARFPEPGATVQDVGHVRSITPPVDMYKKTKLDPGTPIGYQLLGRLARAPHRQVTLEVGYLGAQDVTSYTGLVLADTLARHGIGIGHLVEFSLSTWQAPTCSPLWVVDRIRHPLG